MAARAASTPPAGDATAFLATRTRASEPPDNWTPCAMRGIVAAVTANPTISIATRRDVARLAALHASVAREMTREFGTGGWSEFPSARMVKRQLGASRVLVARREGEVVGTLRLARAQPALFDAAAFTPVANAFYVLGLAVAPGTQRRGVGRALLESAKEATRAAPMEALWLDVYDHPAGAGAFYEKCGFRKVGAIAHGSTVLIGYEWLASAACPLDQGHPIC